MPNLNNYKIRADLTQSIHSIALTGILVPTQFNFPSQLLNVHSSITLNLNQIPSQLLITHGVKLDWAVIDTANTSIPSHTQFRPHPHSIPIPNSANLDYTSDTSISHTLNFDHKHRQTRLYIEYVSQAYPISTTLNFNNNQSR